MPAETKIKSRWIDRWLCSDADELLEREGATPRGIAIIDELNSVYRRTGLTARIVNALLSEAQRIHRETGNPVRIFEIGMRDAALLRQLLEVGASKQIPLEIHGVEFRPDIVALAKTRLSAHGLSVHTYYDPSCELLLFGANEFDIVFSTFVLHHKSQEELNKLLNASYRISRGVVFHLDLTRSLWALVLLWCFYTLSGYRLSRQDAVLSCRRAYRRHELSAIMHELNHAGQAKVVRVFPLYWAITTAFESGRV